jgi:hypothetical protein
VHQVMKRKRERERERDREREKEVGAQHFDTASYISRHAHSGSNQIKFCNQPQLCIMALLLLHAAVTRAVKSILPFPNGTFKMRHSAIIESLCMCRYNLFVNGNFSINIRIFILHITKLILTIISVPNIVTVSALQHCAWSDKVMCPSANLQDDFSLDYIWQKMVLEKKSLVPAFATLRA